jgi:hypothetical protein
MHITTWDKLAVEPKTPIQPSVRVTSGSLDWFVQRWSKGIPTDIDAEGAHHLILAHPWREPRMPSDDDRADAARLTKAIGTYARRAVDVGAPLRGVWFDHPPVGMLRRRQDYMKACERYLLSPVRDVLEFQPPVPVSQYGIPNPDDERLPQCMTVWTLSGAANLNVRSDPERGLVCWVRGPWQYAPRGPVITRGDFSAMLQLCRLVGASHVAVWHDGRRVDAERVERDLALGIDWSRGVPLEWPKSLADVPPATFDMDGLLDIMAEWGPDGMKRLLTLLGGKER